MPTDLWGTRFGAVRAYGWLNETKYSPLLQFYRSVVGYMGRVYDIHWYHNNHNTMYFLSLWSD